MRDAGDPIGSNGFNILQGEMGVAEGKGASEWRVRDAGENPFGERERFLGLFLEFQVPKVPDLV